MGYLLTAKAERMVTRCCGLSDGQRPGSPGGDPMTKLPAGMTTILGASGASQTSRDGCELCHCAKLAALSLRQASRLGGAVGSASGFGSSATVPAGVAPRCVPAAEAR